MKIFLYCTLAIYLLGILTISTSTFAQEEVEISADSCRNAINDRFASLQHEYRRVLFGQQPAANANILSLRFDKDDVAWVKTGDDEWRTLAPDLATFPIGNSQMDATTSTKNRRGIFETRRTVCSELIPYITASIRALRCKAAALCLTTDASFTYDKEDSGSIKVQPVGCIEYTESTIPQCHFAADGDQAEHGKMKSYCDQTAAQLLEYEAEMTKLAFTYDCSYRSTLQFAGQFDIFLEELRWPLTNTIRQAAQVIGSLSRIPCFISSCEDTPVP